MYETISKKITMILTQHNFISEDDAEIYIYSFQIILSTFVTSSFILIWAFLFNQVFYTLLFFIGFSLCRKFSGGYHANSQITCFLFTQIIFLSFLSVVSFFNVIQNKYLFILISLITTIIILIFAPIDNINKPLDNTEKIKFRKKSKRLSLINLAIVFISIHFSLFTNECFCYILGSFSISIMLIFGKIKNILLIKNNKIFKKKGGLVNEKV